MYFLFITYLSIYPPIQLIISMHREILCLYCKINLTGAGGHSVTSRVTLTRCSLICGVVVCCGRLVVAEPVKRDIQSQPQYNVVKTNVVIIK